MPWEGNTYLLYRTVPAEFTALKTQLTTRDGKEVNRCCLSNENTTARNGWGLFLPGLWNLQ